LINNYNFIAKLGDSAMIKNMKIGLRMGLSFGLILIFMIGLIFIGLNAMSVINRQMETIVKTENVRGDFGHGMIDNARETSINLRNLIIFKLNKEPDAKINAIRDLLVTSRASYLDKVDKLKGMLTTNDVTLVEQFSKVNTSREIAFQHQDEVIQLILAGNVTEGSQLLVDKSFPSTQQWVTNINDLLKIQDAISLQRFETAQKAYSNVRTTLIVMGLISFLAALIISITLTISIVRPMKISVDAATRIAANDLSVDVVPEERQDEVGMLYLAFHKMIDNLRRSVQDLNEGVNLLGSSASEILAGTTQVASGTAETSTAISETTTTVEEVQQASKQSALKAKNVADSAQRVVVVSQNGQKAVEETMKSMNRISEQMDSIAQTVVKLSEQSQSIGGIIASVTDIADQSNLLAVNAAIEAANAGEHGRGFAVVAQEIKNLAGQSKQATLQVRNILNDIQKATGAAVMATEQGSKAVESGVKQSLQAGEAIRILGESSNEAFQAATQIVASSQQQVIGMEQIGMAMQNINQAGTETAVSMMQSEKSARNLHELGQKLKEMVERFKL
jgi:methyl-accepting chemotaxis protein